MNNFKRIIACLCFLSACSFLVVAETNEKKDVGKKTPVGKVAAKKAVVKKVTEKIVVKTKAAVKETVKKNPITELVKQLPAQTTPAGKKIISALVSQCPKSVEEIVGLLTKDKGALKANAEFALHGMAFYVTRPGAEIERRKIADALVKAVKTVEEKEAKRLLISQLQLCGSYESIDTLALMLGKEDFRGPATRALVRIQTPKAIDAIGNALTGAKGYGRVVFISALGKLRAEKFTDLILKFAGDGNHDVKLAALWALANIGDPKAAGVLSEAVKSLKNYDKAVAIQWYLLLAKRLAEKGFKCKATKICGEVLQYGKETGKKNIVVSAVRVLTFVQDGQGFTPLFNGFDLVGWQLNGKHLSGRAADPKGYFVNPDGVIECSAHGGGKLLTMKEYSDFVFRFEFKLTKNANNGLGIRAPVQGDAAYNAMEIQILDNCNDYYDKLAPYQYHGSIYNVVPAKRGYQKPVGEWNSEEVIAKGKRITVKLNGQVIVDADLDKAWAGLDEATRKHHTQKNGSLMNKKGHIGFLGHGARLWFRNIRIKEL